VPASVDGTAPEQRILEQSVRLPPGGAVTGWAGCRLWGAAFFDGLAPDGQTPVPVPLAIGEGNVRGDSAVRVMRDRLGPEELVVRFGVPTTRVLRSLFDAMRTSESLDEAVVAMDMMAAAERVSLRRMAGYLECRVGWRGAPLAAAALRWASEDSRSPNETRMRLVWRWQAALPAPLVNQPLFDRRGRLLGIVDLLDPAAGLVGEFDGADHRGARRHSDDVAREDVLRRHGLEVFRVTGPDLAHPGRVARRMREARNRSRWEAAVDRRWTHEPPQWWEPSPCLDDLLDHRDTMNALHARSDARSAPPRRA
jgi:very-short-patch-repair endonuclease